ncbi:DUF5597 domain-containing protein [Microbacterium sp. 1P10UB]|uniref:DUF5597 domain-containing protein n=1 Tax=unclassified Microbacterium TaxID=2609290 RepID=UPI0039A3A7AB
MTDQPTPRPWTISAEAPFALSRDGVPALLLGGQVHNSSSSSPRAVADSFAHLRRIGANTVLAPVSWALCEPVEGSFDFGLVDAMITEARRGGLRLVLLWFGAYKNAASTYAPRWVRADTSRFPRAEVEQTRAQAFSYDGAMAKPVLSVFGAELREADATAFEALIRHIAAADADGTVAMVQVENESGLLGDSRDRSATAEQAWTSAVPPELVAHVRDASAPTTLARTLWETAGQRSAGSWREVFGDSSAGHEVFMAWGFGSYVEHLASRGRAIADIPMYANAWLGPQPGQDEPGQWPSGGPSSRVLDIWHAAAPSLALLGPDIYVQDADAAMAAYATGAQPLFVPECRPRAGELVRAVGRYRAVGWSAFGANDLNPDGQVAATLGLLAALEDEIAAAQQRGSIAAVVLEPETDQATVHIDGVDVTVRAGLALLHRMLLDAGVFVPDLEVSVPDESLPGAEVPHAGDSRPFGLIIGTGDDSFIVVGRELALDFFVTDRRVEIDEVEELLLEDGRLVSGRILNGDERLHLVPTHHVGATRIRLVRV